jgi:hypothetical protein
VCWGGGGGPERKRLRISVSRVTRPRHACLTQHDQASTSHHFLSHPPVHEVYPAHTWVPFVSVSAAAASTTGFLKTDTAPDGLLGLEELRHRDNGTACQSVSYIETNLLPSNKRVEKAMTGHHSCGIMRSTKCEPTVTHCKEANFLMYRWETSLRA